MNTHFGLLAGGVLLAIASIACSDAAAPSDRDSDSGKSNTKGSKGANGSSAGTATGELSGSASTMAACISACVAPNDEAKAFFAQDEACRAKCGPEASPDMACVEKCGHTMEAFCGAQEAACNALQSCGQGCAKDHPSGGSDGGTSSDG